MLLVWKYCLCYDLFICHDDDEYWERKVHVVVEVENGAAQGQSLASKFAHYWLKKKQISY